jgi:hypothetical protein
LHSRRFPATTARGVQLLLRRGKILDGELRAWRRELLSFWGGVRTGVCE